MLIPIEYDESHMYIVISRTITFYTRDTFKHTESKLIRNPKKKKSSSNPQKGEKRETDENQKINNKIAYLNLK